ncbi:hypothetical protein GCM10025771_09880 [Niveibacterium umoris]
MRNSPFISLIIAALCHAGAAEAVCDVPPPDQTLALNPTTLEPGTTWLYAGDDSPRRTTVRLIEADATRRVLEVNERIRMVEPVQTYADESRTRKGTKAVIRFPVKVGDTWRDEFTEEGEFRLEIGGYRYDYEEVADSKAAGWEEISIGAGTFTALRIDRIAIWRKSNPRLLDKKSALAEHMEPPKPSRELKGATVSQYWYVPAIGRVVLQAQAQTKWPQFVEGSSLLKNPSANVIELTGYRDSKIDCTGEKPAFAQRSDAPPLGFAVMPNNTWTWAFQMRAHYPRQTD